MCLPFNWGKQDGHGSGDHHDTPRRQPPRPHPSPDRGNGGYPRQPTVEPSPLDGADHGYGAGENFGAQRRAAGVNVNGEAAGATFYDSHAYGFPDRGPKGFEENGALAPAPQTPVVPTPTSGAPWKRGANMEQKERVAAAVAQHHGPVAASQPKKSAMQTAPVPQMARRDKDDDDSADAASSYRRRRY